MKKLQILIPRFNEQFTDIRPLLDSIAIQQSVDFDEIGIIIRSDGGEPFDGLDSLKKYPFDIDYKDIDKCGVSATRNACLDDATAEYVMFCDADDMFLNICGMYLLFNEMDKGFDSLVSVFVEETRNPDTGEIVYINREMDSTFVHGKVHRRGYLKQQKIRWNDSLTIHEDSYFNILAQSCSQNVKYCPMPFYLWKWRDQSVCRHDPKYILKTYNNMLDSNTALIAELTKRNLRDKAAQLCATMVFDAYYTMNKPEWIEQENQQYRNDVELRFCRYMQEHKSIWDSVSDKDKMMISNGVRSRSVMEGMGMERMTIVEWLDEIGEKYGDCN